MSYDMVRYHLRAALDAFEVAFNRPPDDDEDDDEDEEEAYVMPFYDAILLITLLIGNVFAYATFIRLNWS